MGLQKLTQALKNDLALLDIPPRPWMVEKGDLDVAVIGAGMAGLTVTNALKLLGINNIKIFDQSPAYFEGPWATYARMKTLRSPKELMGPAIGIPHLTFQAWFKAQYGKAVWKKLGKIPTLQWMEYLNWLRQVFSVSIENDRRLLSILPEDNRLKLQFDNQVVFARKVVLATGRGGFGGYSIPPFLEGVDKKYYVHSSDAIDFSKLQGKRVGILGVGASAFDNAAAAIENGAAQVDLLSRRTTIPYINKFASLNYPGNHYGFYFLDDSSHWRIMKHSLDSGSLPPIESLKRVKGHPNLYLKLNIQIEKVFEANHQIMIKTAKEEIPYDFLILATGFNIDGRKEAALHSFFDEILLWSDRMPAEDVKKNRSMGAFPYLGDHFQFLEKHQGDAPFLRNIYCFNYAATMSHGLISSDIPAISVGAKRLSEGIAADFFVQDQEAYYRQLEDYQVAEFHQEEFFE